ncbi:MAG: hypothetical protein K1X71_04700 [Pirellulales bacterium]|nr:hypothetical protein [Pirellulales bacterium]
MRSPVTACLVLLVALSCSNIAHAQPCGGAGVGAWFPGYWYNIYGMESIPYYQLHPPVYYSVPVPRTYGWSPFAYPPGTMTPEVEMIEPQVMNNPFVPREDQAASTDGRVAVRPLRVANPFAVESDAQLSQTQ